MNKFSYKNIYNLKEDNIPLKISNDDEKIYKQDKKITLQKNLMEDRLKKIKKIKIDSKKTIFKSVRCIN
jgi:hypothetical protein